MTCSRLKTEIMIELPMAALASPWSHLCDPIEATLARTTEVGQSGGEGAEGGSLPWLAMTGSRHCEKRRRRSDPETALQPGSLRSARNEGESSLRGAPATKQSRNGTAYWIASLR